MHRYMDVAYYDPMDGNVIHLRKNAIHLRDWFSPVTNEVLLPANQAMTTVTSVFAFVFAPFSGYHLLMGFLDRRS